MTKSSFPNLSKAQNAEIDKARAAGWKVDLTNTAASVPIATRVLTGARHYLAGQLKEPGVKNLPLGPDCWTDNVILYCGHRAVFRGDIIVTPHAVTVIASKVRAGVIQFDRTEAMMSKAQWHIDDSHPGGYWNSSTGRFVLPRSAVTRLE